MRVNLIAIPLIVLSAVIHANTYISLDVNPDTISFGYIANNYISLEVGVTKIKVYNTIKTKKTPGVCDKGRIDIDTIYKGIESNPVYAKTIKGSFIHTIRGYSRTVSSGHITTIDAKGKCVYIKNISGVDKVIVVNAPNRIYFYRRYQGAPNAEAFFAHKKELAMIHDTPSTPVTTINGNGVFKQDLNALYNYKADFTHTYENRGRYKNMLNASVLLHTDLNNPFYLFSKHSYNKYTKGSTFIGIGANITKNISTRLGWNMDSDKLNLSLIWEF